MITQSPSASSIEEGEANEEKVKFIFVSFIVDVWIISIRRVLLHLGRVHVMREEKKSTTKTKERPSPRPILSRLSACGWMLVIDFSLSLIIIGL